MASAFPIAIFVPTFWDRQSCLSSVPGAHPYLFRESFVAFPVDRNFVLYPFRIGLAMPLGSEHPSGLIKKSWPIGLPRPNPHKPIVYKLGLTDFYLAYLAGWEPL